MMMGTVTRQSWWIVLLALVSALGCTRPEERSAAPLATATPAAATTAPGAEEDEEDVDEPLGPDFEIAIEVSSYFGPAPLEVAFKVKARNGTPPVTFTWNFGDGSSPATGEAMTHTYTKLGRIDAFVTGQDANGEKDTIQMLLFSVTPEEYLRQKEGADVPLPGAAPAATP